MISIRKSSSAEFYMFGCIKPKLGEIFYDLYGWLQGEGVEHIIITSIIRPKTEDSGVHYFKRAIDIADTFPREIGERLEEYINKKYPYDIKRPEKQTLIYHSTNNAGDDGLHYHLQVMGD